MKYGSKIMIKKNVPRENYIMQYLYFQFFESRKKPFQKKLQKYQFYIINQPSKSDCKKKEISWNL